MFVKMKDFMSGAPIIVNTDMIIRVIGLKERNGSCITMHGNSKLMVEHGLDDIFDAISDSELTTDLIMNQIHEEEEG